MHDDSKLSSLVSPAVASPPALRPSSPHDAVNPLHLRLSAYDPRAAGGRHAVRLQLPASFAVAYNELELRVRCDLLPLKVGQYRFTRALDGQWQTVLLSFSSRNKEHGQYPLELELRAHRQDRQPETLTANDMASQFHGIERRWLCHSILFLPRSDSSLSEIHQVFLAQRRQVRILAEDGAIARIQQQGALPQDLQVDVHARDGALAQLDLQTSGALGSATSSLPKATEHSPSCLAWDEALIEVALTPQLLAENLRARTESLAQHAMPKPLPLPSSTLQQAIDSQGRALPHSIDCEHLIRHHRLRIVAADHWRIGRQTYSSERDHSPAPQLNQAPGVIAIDHPRISAQHARIEYRDGAFILHDHSRFGIRRNQTRLHHGEQLSLAEGQLIDWCASFPGQCVWQVLTISSGAQSGHQQHQPMCILRCQHPHGAYEHICLIQATSLTPSMVQATFAVLAQAYASPEVGAMRASLPKDEEFLLAAYQGQALSAWQLHLHCQQNHSSTPNK